MQFLFTLSVFSVESRETPSKNEEIIEASNHIEAMLQVRGRRNDVSNSGNIYAKMDLKEPNKEPFWTFAKNPKKQSDSS